MCRNIKLLFNFEPPTTDDEVRAAALQYVRKVSGMTKPAQVNEAAFQAAVDEVFLASRRLVDSLKTSAPPHTREEEARKGKERFQKRQARMASGR